MNEPNWESGWNNFIENLLNARKMIEDWSTQRITQLVVSNSFYGKLQEALDANKFPLNISIEEIEE